MTQYIPHLWLGLSLLGMVLSFLALREVSMDYLSSRVLTNGRRAVAVIGFLGESIRFVMYVLFAGVGVFYLASERAVNRGGVGWVMVLALVLLLIKTALQLWLNRYLYKTSRDKLDREV